MLPNNNSRVFIFHFHLIVYVFLILVRLIYSMGILPCSSHPYPFCRSFPALVPFPIDLSDLLCWYWELREVARKAVNPTRIIRFPCISLFHALQGDDWEAVLGRSRAPVEPAAVLGGLFDEFAFFGLVLSAASAQESLRFGQNCGWMMSKKKAPENTQHGLLRYWVGLAHLVQLVNVPFLQKTVCPIRLIFSRMLSVGHSGQYQLVVVRTGGICEQTIERPCFV